MNDLTYTSCVEGKATTAFFIYLGLNVAESSIRFLKTLKQVRNGGGNEIEGLNTRHAVIKVEVSKKL